MSVQFKTLTIGSAQPGSFHAGLLLHSGSLARSVEFMAAKLGYPEIFLVSSMLYTCRVTVLQVLASSAQEELPRWQSGAGHGVQ
jgi:hypothetical protein